MNTYFVLGRKFVFKAHTILFHSLESLSPLLLGKESQEESKRRRGSAREEGEKKNSSLVTSRLHPCLGYTSIHTAAPRLISSSAKKSRKLNIKSTAVLYDLYRSRNFRRLTRKYDHSISIIFKAQLNWQNLCKQASAAYVSGLVFVCISIYRQCVFKSERPEQREKSKEEPYCYTIYSFGWRSSRGSSVYVYTEALGPCAKIRVRNSAPRG